MATGGVGLHMCPLCNAPVEGGDQLQIHYLTSCSGYDHGDSGASSNEAHPPPAPPPSSSVTSAPAALPGATDRGGAVPGNQHLIQFLWQPLTLMTYPNVTLLTSSPESGSIDLRLDKDAADRGFYCSDRVLVGEGVYEGQLVIGDSFIHPVKKFFVDSSSAGIVVLEFELSHMGDGVGSGASYDTSGFSGTESRIQVNQLGMAFKIPVASVGQNQEYMYKNIIGSDHLTMATGGVDLHTCPLCNAPVEGGDQLQVHYLTSCSGYDHGGTGVSGASSNEAHPPPAPPPSSSVTSAPAASSGATARGGAVPGNQHLIQFMWQPRTPMSYPKVTLLTSPESGSIDLRLDKDAADGGFYCSDRVLVGEGVYEGQLVVGDSFINPVKKFFVDSSSAGIVVLEFELSHMGDGVGSGASYVVNEESQAFLREAMKKGYVYVTLVKVMVEGPAGVGKTCLVYLLLKKSPPQGRTSTGCAERAIRVVRVGKEGGEWSEISNKQFQEMIAEAIPILYQELKDEGKGMEDLAKVLFDLGMEGVDVEGEGEEGAGGVGGERKKQQKSGSPNGGEDSKAVIDGVIQKLTQLVGGGKSSRRLLDMDLIFLTDSGGQQAYWDLAPVFLRDTSATIFVHRLCEKLDDHPLNDLYQSGKQVGPSQRATLTTAEAFKTMLRGLHKGEKRSKIITVGTHKDLVGECEETPDQKNKRFCKIASPHFKNDLVYRNEEMEEVIFQVNTGVPKEDDRKEASKIRESIVEGATRVKIPIWWFILQLILEALSHKLGRYVLSKKECVNVSNTLGFSEGELDAALAFFDKLNIFLYKKHILPHVVFTSAQVPLDKLSRLVKKQYHLKAVNTDPRNAADRAMTGDWKRFRDNGILTPKFLNECKAHYVDGIFTLKDFLVLLEKLLIVSRLSANDYFFPAILNMTPEVRISEYLRALKIAALVVEFPTDWAPPGVYCCSVCHLQSHAHWKIVEKALITPGSRDTPHTQISRISRNCITFSKRGRPGSVTFIDNFSFFLACVNVDTSKMEHCDLVKHCQCIQSELLSAVEAGLKNTHHIYSHPVTAFLCPQRNDFCSTELHTAHVSENGKQWICSANSNVFDNLTPEQTLWLCRPESSAAVSSEPTMKDLANRVAAVIPGKWIEVAIQLDISMEEIDAIGEDKGSVFKRFMAVLNQWKRSCRQPFTWGALATALKSTSVNEFKLAEKLLQEFL